MGFTNQESPFSDTFLEDMRNRMFAARNRAAAEYDDLGDLALEPSGQDAAFEQPADYGSEEYAKDINLDLLGKESQLLALLDEAIARIDGRAERPYGLCEVCEETPKKLCRTCPWIAEERLRNSPWVRNCRQAQEELERRDAAT